MVELIPVLNDNYIFLFLDPESQSALVVDPAQAAPVRNRLEQLGYSLQAILNTHHHWDHVGGNLELKDWAQCPIYASQYDIDQQRIPGGDHPLKEGDVFEFAGQKSRILELPGHTLGHIAYHFADDHILFVGDTLFSMGCGRLFEGSPEQMHDSLQKIAQLPAETEVYCTHEYTLANGDFAQSIEPDNPDLQERLTQVREMRALQQPTVPTQIGLELITNPFLRTESCKIREHLQMTQSAASEVFGELRARKDNF